MRMLCSLDEIKSEGLLKIIFLIVLLLLIPFAKSSFSATIEVFETNCPHCLKLKKDFFPQIKSIYQIEIIYYNLGEPENYKIYAEKLKKFNLPVSIPEELPVVFYGKNILIGEKEVREQLISILKNNPSFVSKGLRRFCLPVVIVSGLLDGINPCAFAVIIFFISFLSAVQRKNKELLFTGVFYIAGVFLTYFLLGLGIFRIIDYFNNLRFLKLLLYGLAGAGCFCLGIFSLLDFFNIKKGNIKNIKLKLRMDTRKKINNLISHFLMHRTFLPFAFFLGVIVSLLESGCTGQVYIPTLIFLGSEAREKKVWYLFLYNFFFILPLILIFLFSLFGIRSKWLAKFQEKNLYFSKLSLAIFFFSLGFLFIYLLFEKM